MISIASIRFTVLFDYLVYEIWTFQILLDTFYVSILFRFLNKVSTELGEDHIIRLTPDNRICNWFYCALF